LNYFFELPSKWAKQNKELLMLSIIFAEGITPGSQEEQVRSKIREFVQKLKEIEDIFKGFYVHDKLHFQIAQRNQILAKRTTLKKLVGDFQHSLEVELELAPF